MSGEKEFFADMVVEAVSTLDPTTLDLKMIGIKKVIGGGLRDSFLVDGVAFKKTFSYAGFEQQPKSFANPKILLLNIELELKAEKENAEVGGAGGRLGGMWALGELACMHAKHQAATTGAQQYCSHCGRLPCS